MLLLICVVLLENGYSDLLLIIMTRLFAILILKLYDLFIDWDINPLLVISFANVFSYSSRSFLFC